MVSWNLTPDNGKNSFYLWFFADFWYSISFSSSIARIRIKKSAAERSGVRDANCTVLVLIAQLCCCQ